MSDQRSWHSSGLWTLQDHSDPTIPVELRQLMAGSRYVEDDEYGRPKAGEKTDGPIHGGLLWPVHDVSAQGQAGLNGAAPRAVGAWGFAFAAVATQANKPAPRSRTQERFDPFRVFDPNAPIGVLGSDARADFAPLDDVNGLGIGGGNEPGSAAAQGGSRARRTIRVLPVGSSAFTADTRFAELGAALSPLAPRFPAGTPGVVLASTNENRQEELFLPTSTGLVAVNKAGDPSLGSLVYDLTEKDALDPERFARLHSLMRVVLPIPEGDRVGARHDESGVLALQFGKAGRDNLAGLGLCHGAPSSGGQIVGTLTPGRNVGIDVPQGFTGRTTRERLVNTTVGHDPAAALGANPGTQERPGTGNPGTQERAAAVIAALPYEGVGGFVDLGGDGCPHKLFKTKDGEQGYSAHVSVFGKFRGLGGDGRLNFEPLNSSNPDPLPFLSRGHIVWRPSNQGTAGGTTGAQITEGPFAEVGRWVIECEVPDYSWPPPDIPDWPDDPQKPRKPDDPTTPGDPGDPGDPTGGGGDDGVGRDGGGTDHRFCDGHHFGGGVILGPGRQGKLVFGKSNVQYGRGLAYPTTPHMRVMPGIGFRAPSFQLGEWDPRPLGRFTKRDLLRANENPLVARLEAYAVMAGDAPGADFSYTNAPHQPNGGGTPTATGSVAFVAPERDLKDLLHGITHPGTSTTSTPTFAFTTGTQLGFGTPLRTTGGVGDGFKVTHTSTTLTFSGQNATGGNDATKTVAVGTNLSVTGTTTLTTPLGVGSGGTGITTTPTNGQIPIGNGTNYVAATITAGSGVTVTNGSGSITIAASGGSSGYGDGSDGAGTIAGTTTLTADMNYTSLTVQNGGTLITDGFKIYVQGTCTVDAGGLIHNDGNAGSDGFTSSGGAAGATNSSTSATLGRGAAGGAGNAAAGSNGTGLSVCGGGSAGNGGAGVAAAGTAGSKTGPQTSDGTFRAGPMALSGRVFPNSGAPVTVKPGCGGGGGGGDNVNDRGGGGGGGAGVVLIAAATITNNGTIRAKGGNGGAGSSSGGACGGGGGGGGGVIFLIASSITAGTATITGGTGGAAGAGGAAGSNGGSGVVVQCQG